MNDCRIAPLVICGDLVAEADPYEEHFGLNPSILTDAARKAVDQRSWVTSRRNFGKLGGVVESAPEGAEHPFISSTQHKVYCSYASVECGTSQLSNLRFPRR